MTEEELPDAELRWDREEAPLVWYFQARGDLLAPKEFLKLGPRGREFKALSQFYQKLALEIHIMSLWTMKEADFCSMQWIQIGFLNLVVCNHGTLKYTSTIDELAKSFHLNKSCSILISYNCMVEPNWNRRRHCERSGDHHALLNISIERTIVNVYDSRGSQRQNIHPFIEALKNLVNALSGSQVWPLSPFRNLDDLRTYFESVAKLFLTVFHHFHVFQTEVSSTPGQTDLEISGFQEDLSGSIIDKVMNPKGVYHLL
ncbi:unnamed protein product [Miscanthus lutarioriparius]|uniref:Uncharacterized protein n=1 Tax=Miscanthus lutarioriparius TaxID=422564 RepID=A0A811RRY2_9POAL|nr:unnamed protein product [Miscanthus lutarioriparius]